MKKKLISFGLIIIVCFFCACCGKPNNEPASEELSASEATVDLANEALKQMEDNNVIISADLCETSTQDVSRVYELYKEQIPIMQELEDLEDSSAALILLYEEQIEYLKNHDYYEICRNRSRAAYDDSYVFRTMDPEGFSALKKRDNIESLLAMKEYFDRLDDSVKMRFAEDLCDRFNYCAPVEMEVDGFIWNVKFFELNGSQLFNDIVSFSINGQVMSLR